MLALYGLRLPYLSLGVVTFPDLGDELLSVVEYCPHLETDTQRVRELH